MRREEGRVLESEVMTKVDVCAGREHHHLDLSRPLF